MICTSCQKELADGVSRCPACGAEQPARAPAMPPPAGPIYDPAKPVGRGVSTVRALFRLSTAITGTRKPK